MSAVLPRRILERDRDSIRAVLASYGVSEAGIFGSVARRQGTRSSDRDLIVRFDAARNRAVIGLSDALTRLTAPHQGKDMP